MKIAVVDDEFTTLALIEKALAEDGHEVTTYADGSEALAGIDPAVDMVLSDLFMPGMNGEELFQAVRERFPDKPFVYLTAASDIATAVKLVREGATDLIRKPIDPSTLQIRIERIMYDQERRRAIKAITREQELVRRENQRLTTWRMLYASKDVRQTRQLVDNLSRSVAASGGFDWVDLLDDMKVDHDDEHYLIPRAVVDLAISSARDHQALLHRITEIGALHGADPIEETAAVDEVRTWVREYGAGALRELGQRYGREIAVGLPGTLPADRRVRWDRTIGEGVLYELVCNAIKFSPPESPVALDLAVGRAGTVEHLQISVRNRASTSQATDGDGNPIVGVPDELSEQVFELFFTIESFPVTLEEEKWTDGTGLYYVRTMARLLGGWADIRSGVDYSRGDPVPQVIAEVRIPLE